MALCIEGDAEKRLPWTSTRQSDLDAEREEINRHAELWSCSQRNRAATSPSENGERLRREKAAGWRQSCLEGALAGVPPRRGVQCESQTPLLMQEGDVAFQECLESDKNFN